MTKWQSFALPFGHDLDGAGGLFGAVAGQHLARIGNQRAVLLGQQRDARTRGGAGGVYRVFYTLLAQQAIWPETAERSFAPSRSSAKLRFAIWS